MHDGAERDSIVRHTEAMRCEFVFGRDPIAFTVNSLCVGEGFVRRHHLFVAEYTVLLLILGEVEG